MIHVEPALKRCCFLSIENIFFRSQYISIDNMGTSHLGIPYVENQIFQIGINSRVFPEGTSPIVLLISSKVDSVRLNPPMSLKPFF